LFSLATIEEKKAYLKAYSQTYLQEEIRAEQLVRKLDPFREFLEVSAQSNGKILNFNKIGREIGVDSKTVLSYFQILEDTCLGFLLPGFHRSIRKSQTIHPKFYYFDCGVKKSLERSLDVFVKPSTSAYGEAFEHFVILEIYRLNEYLSLDYRLSYFQTKDGAEIDLILSKRDEDILVEIKSAEKVDPIEVAKLERLSRDFPNPKTYYLSRDPDPQKLGSIDCLPWHMGLKKIFKLD
jgi:predicted AAA+ superfamily ATPase